MQQIKSQLTVVGAGPAGICAALSAARQGIDTVLICERPVLGGNSSSEFRVWTRGATGAGNLFAEEMGIWGELKLLNLYRNPDANPIFWDETLLDAVLGQDHLRLFLNTTVFMTHTEENRIQYVHGVQLGTEKELLFVSDFYIDASGDGSIAEQAGMKYTVGNPKGTLGSSILYYTKKEDHPVKFVAPDYAYSFEKIQQLMNHGGRIISEKMSGCDCWWFEYGGTKNTIEDEQEITLELKRLVLGVWNYIKNSGQFAAENYTLEWIGNMAGKRESRRMETAAVLKASDIYQGMQFLDAGFYGGWYIDYHPPGGINDSDEENCIQRPVHVYPIPLRCLYGNVANLAVAGRIIGTDSEAFCSSRVMNTCALSGQAAGVLAASCVQQKKDVAALTGNDFLQMQIQLIKGDMFLPGNKETDDKDILLQAHSEASSTSDSRSSEPIGELSLEDGVFAVFPADAGRAEIALRSETANTLTGVVYPSSLPNRYLKEGTLLNYRWDLRPGENTIQIDLPQQLQGKLAVIAFKHTKDVFLKYTEKTRPGFLCGIKDSSLYYEPCINISAATPVLYSPDNVTDGYNRIWNHPHAWLSAADDQSPWLKTTLKEPQSLKEIRIYLDPDLSMELINSRTEQWRADHKYTKRESMPGQLIRNMTIQAELDDGTWEEIASVKENCRRLVIIPVKEEKKIRSIKLLAMETWGHKPPVVYELSAYRR